MASQVEDLRASHPRVSPRQMAFILLPMVFAVACIVLLMLPFSPAAALTKASFVVQPSPLTASEAIALMLPFDPSTELDQTQSRTNIGRNDLVVGHESSANPLAPNNDPLLIWDTTWDPAPRSTHSVAWGDVDGDGDLDLAVGNSDQPNRLYRNDGTGLMLDTAWNPITSSTTTLAWGDVDGDGDLDLLVGNFAQPNQLYRNAAGALTLDTTWNPNARFTTNVAWGDVDGDGDLDLAVGNSDQPNQLYRNAAGTLTLDTMWSPNARYTTSVAWGDMDGDGGLDLLVGNSSQPNQLYHNNGGDLTLDTMWVPTPGPTQSVAWGDVDDDGDLDLLVGNYDLPNQLYRNTGGTLMDTGWNPVASKTTSVAWGDVDGDGDLDLLVGNYTQPSQLYRNTGGSLTLDAGWNPVARYTNSVALGDVDGDSDLDLLVGNGMVDNKSSQLYRNAGATLTLDLTWNPPARYTTKAAWADVDGDGDLDLLAGNYNQSNQLYRNNNGILALDTTWNPIARATFSVAWGDVDSDGDPDLLVGNNNQPNQLYRNNNGVLVLDTTWNPIARATLSVAWGDVDSDGDLDLLVGNADQPNQLYRNSGGTLGLDPAWNPEPRHTTSVAWGDVDGDGDLDLLVGNSSYQPNQLYRNSGKALVLDLEWNPAARFTTSLAWGDVDGDGDLDLLVGNSDQPNQLYRNNSGILVLDTMWNPIACTTLSVAWGDVDGDGDLDLLVGNNYQPNQLYRNTGGNPTLDTKWNPVVRTTLSAAWGDVDGDGDFDLLVGNAGANQLYRNGGRGLSGLPDNILSPDVLHPLRSANFFATAQILGSPVIPITYTLSDPEGDPVGSLRTFYSPDGGGKWYTATAAGGPITPNLSCQSLPGLVGYWPFDEASGTTAHDQSGNGYDLTLYNAAFSTTTPYTLTSSTHALDLTRLNDFASRGSVPKIEQLQDLSIAFWVRPDTIPASGIARFVTLGIEKAVLRANVGKLHFYMKFNGVLYHIEKPGVLVTGTYQHVAGTYDSTQHMMRLYLNGAQIASLSVSGTVAAGNGIGLDDGGSEPYQGLLDDLCIYNRALSPAEVAALARNRDFPSEEHFTLGSALKLDGANDYVEIAAVTPTLQITRSLTLEAWVKLPRKSSTGSAATTDQAILGNYNPTLDVTYMLNVYGPDRSQPGIVEFGGTCGSPGWLTGNTIVDDDRWHHISAVRDYSTGRAAIYVDGLLDSSGTMAGIFCNSSAPLRIGLGHHDAYVKGMIDEVRVWNVVRTQAQIQANMRQTLPRNTPNLVGYWRFNETYGTQAYNQATISLTGTLKGGVTRALAAMAYVYNWDTFASGFFGQSDNVVFRMEAYPDLGPSVGSVPVFQHPYASATTFPFRVRGTQVQVVTATLTGTRPISQAIVYQLPKDQTLNAEAIADGAGQPFNTDGLGYLQGRGRLEIGDRLMALAPVHTQLRNGSLVFDGLNDDVAVPYSPALNPTNFTVEAWINADTWAAQSWEDTIVSTETGAGQKQGFTLRGGDQGRLTLIVACGDAWPNASSAQLMAPSTWYHVAGTYDGSTLRIFLNGDLVGTGACASGYTLSTLPLRIGAASNDVNRNFDGQIDEVRVWSVARTQTQIQADMDRALRGNEPNLVGYWPFDEGTGSLAPDWTSNHNDGTLVGASWSGGGEHYTLYHTSAAPNTIGLSMTAVVTPGVQTLVVTSSNPLVLFNLDVSLEWDARQDQQFLTQLEHDLHVASEALYDWSNGQAALGGINVYFQRDHWAEADLQIYASNRLRPNAAQGGIVNATQTDPITVTGVITYEPGQINMGVAWNRYGETTGNLGEDWPHALAHEISHYALFLDDDYLGLDASKNLIPVGTCTGTAMSDPYREDYSEFHPGGLSWASGCASTLAAQETGRWDWATITTFYPWLKSAPTNTGPAGLPLAVTHISFVEPTTPSVALPAPIFNLTHNGALIQPGSDARAFLYHADQITDLGTPEFDQVNARGAQIGDRVCVYDRRAHRQGCEVISFGDEELALSDLPTWQPTILVSPVNSRTISLTVVASGLPATTTVSARLYPIDTTALPTLMLSKVGGVYTGVFTLTEPIPQGYVQVWVNESEPRRESVIDFGLGGGGAYRHGRGAYRHGRGAYRHGRGAYRHGRGAPTQSPDGQVVVFADGLTFGDDDFFALQAINDLPTQLPGRTLVGQAYRLLKSATAPNLTGKSIGFYYAGRDVPAGEENFLRVYFWDGLTWQPLSTTLDTTYNIAAATIPATAGGMGIYALMSSLEIPLYGPGWDLFPYPLQVTRTVTNALQSIAGYYSLVYGYDGRDLADHWKVYASGVPSWVIDLTELRFGEAYWISLTQPITLYLSSVAAPDQVSLLQSPPATYYGNVQAGSNFSPAAGLNVTAWVGNKTCGQSTTQNMAGQIVYSLNVNADGPGGAIGCGAPGREVIFTVNGLSMLPKVMWNNDAVWSVALQRDRRLYLPLIRKD